MTMSAEGWGARGLIHPPIMIVKKVTKIPQDFTRRHKYQ